MTTPHHPCDLILRGGVTSGVVYPGAVTELAKRWRFRSIGGGSAGAIAAAVTAAAEYGRQNGNPNAFEDHIAPIPQTLGITDGSGRTRLERLFAPTPALEPLMRAALGIVNGSPLLPIARLLVPAIVPAFAIAAIVAALLLAGFTDHGLGAGHAFILALIFALTLAVPIALALIPRLFHRHLAAVTANGFGLVGGANPDLGADATLEELEEKGHLSDWLHAQIQRAAGLPPERPLTVGDLWGNPATVSPWTQERAIDLMLTTTNLSQQLPHQFPFLERPQSLLYFRREDLAPVLPAAVLDSLCDRSRANWDLEVDGQGTYHRLPSARELPVLLGVRLSLSFPGLLAAVRLHETIGWSPGDTQRQQEAARQLRPCWFSDGGLTSNFPVTAFDTPLPGRPTFCINLSDLAPQDSPSVRVTMPADNNDGMRARHLGTIASVPGFVSAIVATIRNARENELQTVAGQRDRIATIRLTANEGGINLGMQAPTIERLSEYGTIAGQMLSNRFHPDGKPDAAGMDWNNHRWMRLRSTLAATEGLLFTFDKAYRDRPPYGSSWPHLLRASTAKGRYRWDSADARDRAVAEAQALANYAEALATVPLPSARPDSSIFNGRREFPRTRDSLSRTGNAPLPAMRYRLIPNSGRDPQQF